MIKHNLQTSSYLCVSMTNIVEFSRGFLSVQMTPTSNHSWNICNSPIVSTMTSHVWVLVVNEGNWKVAPSLGLCALSSRRIMIGRLCSTSRKKMQLLVDCNLPSWELTYGCFRKNSGTLKSSILIGFSIIFTIHFGGFPPIFGNTHISLSKPLTWVDDFFLFQGAGMIC